MRGPGLEHVEFCDRNVVVFVGGNVQIERSFGNRTTSCPPSPKSAPRTSQCGLVGDLIVNVVLGPGLGHLEFCEGPEDCAARETEEETRVRVNRVEFVAISSDILPDPPRHYITIWMRGEAEAGDPEIGDTREIAELGWFAPEELPAPLLPDFKNLVEGRHWPELPPNLPLAGPRRS